MKKKVFIGLSGGVDSSVAALLLIEQGYEVTAVYMKNWSGEGYGLEDNCPWEDDLEFVRAVTEELKIPLKIYNFEKEYRAAVMDDFFAQYKLGNTPNPDILCNKFIKFSAFLDRSKEDGADFIATGHYAKTENGRLFRPKDRKKDQTYFLSAVKSSQLEKVLFPLADLEKPEVRAMALKNSLPSAKRADSQGICFIGEVDIKDFLAHNLKVVRGEIVDTDTGQVVGEHDGVWFYTHGQRKGLKVGGMDKPYFVSGKDVSSNTLYVAKGKDNPLLWSREISGKELQLIDEKEPLEQAENLTATIRYRGEATEVTLKPIDDRKAKKSTQSYTAHFTKPQWAPSPGQSIVFYDGEQCLGVATIS